MSRPSDPPGQPPGRRPSAGAGGRGAGGRGAHGASVELHQKVAQLVRDAGIPRPWAWQVARGEATLNDVVMRLARVDQTRQLMTRHRLDKSTATQVAAGTLDLDDVLRRLRMAEHLAKFRGRARLERAQSTGQRLSLFLHGLRCVSGRVLEVLPYEVQLELLGPTDDAPLSVQTVHKLQIKLVHDWDAKVAISMAAGGRSVAEPIRRPQDRYACSDRRLFVLHDDGKKCRIVTLEGDQVVGQVAWVGRFELGLRQKGGVELVVYRHAIAELTEA